MTKRSSMNECNSLMDFDAIEDHARPSPQDPENVETESGHRFLCDKERARCKIKVRIHHLDADQTYQLQQLLEQFAADASTEFDVKLSMKQHRPTSSFASSLSQLSEDYQVPASSSPDVLDYIMQACEPSLAGSVDPPPLSPTRSSDLADDYLDEPWQMDEYNLHGDSGIQLPSSLLTAGSPRAGFAYRFPENRRFDKRSVVSAPVV